MRIIKGNTEVRPAPIYSQKDYSDQYWFLDLWLQEANKNRDPDYVYYCLTVIRRKILNITQYLLEQGRAPKMANNDNDKYAGYSFVNWKPNTQEKKYIKDKIKDGFDYDLALEEVIAEGYKLSVSYVVNSDSFVASLTCKDPKDSNYKQTLTLWHKNAIVACAGVLIAHIDLLGTDWTGADLSRSEHDW